MPQQEPTSPESGTETLTPRTIAVSVSQGTKPRENVPARVLEHPVGNKNSLFCSRSKPKFRCLLLFASSYYENLEDHAVLELFLLSSRLSRK